MRPLATPSDARASGRSAARTARQLAFGWADEERARDPEVRACERIASRLTRVIGAEVDVALTRNRRTMISSKRSETHLQVRLHRMFAEADAPTLDALGLYVKTGDAEASARLGEFIEEKRDLVAAEPAPSRPTQVLGDIHDLGAIARELEADFFAGQLVGVSITWGKRGPAGRAKRSVRLGTYVQDERLVRIHPVLDQLWVPRFFVRYVVFHELLHHVEPAVEHKGRVNFHTPRFREREAAYPDYARAIAWERAHIARLLGAPRAS